MYQALYRKYRPQSFFDVVSQDTVKKILINSIKNNKISHAYLFSGPRGIGKTSIAKIFAKAVNCLSFDEKGDSCLKCENCMDADNGSVDILEIDAASNNGVDQIRELKSKVNIVPSKQKYKVYIIDEVHMLSNSAFNALLKTLEEPPSHVIFILATTEFYEVPETIVSRCQCFSFNRISNECLIERLRYICDNEKIEVDDDVLKEIAIYSNGGLRDAISMLDKLASFSDNKITMEDFITINGLISQSDIVDTYNFIFDNNVAEVLNMIKKIDNCGYDFGNFVERLMIYIRDLIVNSYTGSKLNIDVSKNIIAVNKLNDLLNALKNSLNPLVIVEVMFLDILIKLHDTKKNSENDVSCEIKENIVSEKEVNVPKDIKKEVKIEKRPSFVINEDIKNIRINNALAGANLAFKNAFLNNWNKINDYRLDKKYGKIVQLLGLSNPMIVSDKYVVITSNRESTIERMYEIYDEIESFLKVINNHDYYVAFVNEKDFEIIKNKYINDKKNGIIYTCQDENDSLVTRENKKGKNELLDKAINVFGSDLVEFEEE